MPDTLTRRDQDATNTIAEAIRRERRPLPAHDLDGNNHRAWASAVCQAEVNHRGADYLRACSHLRITLDDSIYGEEVGQFAHECHAGAALNWMSHLQTHDGDRHGPWSSWAIWTREQRIEWLQRRRHLLHGFLRQVRKYRAARAIIDRPVPVFATRVAA